MKGSNQCVADNLPAPSRYYPNPFGNHPVLSGPEHGMYALHSYGGYAGSVKSAYTLFTFVLMNNKPGESILTSHLSRPNPKGRALTPTRASARCSAS